MVHCAWMLNLLMFTKAPMVSFLCLILLNSGTYLAIIIF